MNDDALSAFIDAYREEHAPRTLDARGLRTRVVAAAGRRRLFGGERLRFLVPLAATFAASAALAASPPVRDGFRELLGLAPSGIQAERVDGAPRVAPRARSVSSVAPMPAPLEPLIVASDLPVEPAPARRARAVSNDGRGAVAAPVVSATPAASANADLALYREAHRLHFNGADRKLTLAAWDAYLAAYPAGTFAPEARINRAVCLAQLGRRAEAKDVLVEIEQGRFGQEGRAQAEPILKKLDGER